MTGYLCTVIVLNREEKEINPVNKSFSTVCYNWEVNSMQIVTQDRNGEGSDTFERLL